MTALPLTMNRKNIVKVRERGKTLTECLSALTECSEKSIRDTLGDLNDTGWGVWDKGKGTFKVNKDVATCDTKAPTYEGLALAVSESDRIRLQSRISGLFEVETRTKYRDKNEEKEMTRAMMKKIDALYDENQEMKQTLREMMELMRKLVAGDEDARITAERHLRLVESE